MFLASVDLHSFWGKKPQLFVLLHGLFRNGTPSLTRLFLLGVAEITHFELNLPFVYLRGRIPCISAVFHTVGDQRRLSKVNLAAEDQWLSCWEGVTSQACSNANLSTTEEALAV